MTPTPVGMRCPECAGQRTRVTRGVPRGGQGFIPGALQFIFRFFAPGNVLGNPDKTLLAVRGVAGEHTLPVHPHRFAGMGIYQPEF